MADSFATAWDVKSSQNIFVARPQDGSGDVVVCVMDYDNPETMQAVRLSAKAAGRIAEAMAPDRGSAER